MARIHALWTLDGLGGLVAADIAKALRDSHAAVRENAVRLAEARLGVSRDLLLEVLRLADDQHDRVRFQVAIAIGETNEPRAIEALAHIARRDGADRWMRAAILSSVKGRVGRIPSRVRRIPPIVRCRPRRRDAGCWSTVRRGQRARTLPRLDSRRSPIRTGSSARNLRPSQALRRDCAPADSDGETRSAFMALLSSDSAQARAARTRVETVLSRSSTLALDERVPADQRLAAIELFGHTDYPSVGKTLESLLAPRHPSEIQIAAVRALTQLPDRTATAALVDRARWLAFTPEVRETVLAVLLSEERHTLVLLDALEHGSIPATALGSSRRNRLRTHRDAAIQQRAVTLFAAVDAGNRMQRVRAVARHRAAEDRQFDPRQTALRDSLRDVPLVRRCGRPVGTGLERHPQPAGRRHPAARGRPGLRDHSRLPGIFR